MHPIPSNPKILVLHSSANLKSSHSRHLTQFFIEQWLIEHPQSKITQRDLAVKPIPPLMPDTLEAIRVNKPIEELTTGHEARKFSDELVMELKNADVILMGVPMYNFNVPSTLKTYIDYITRSGVTFGYDPVEKRSKGFISGKKVIVITSSAGVYENSEIDFQGPYLKWILSYLGLDEDLTFIKADGLSQAEEKVAQSIQKVKDNIQAYIKQAE